MALKLTAKEKWYFIRQDIVSYSISTLLYLSLCLIREFNINSVIYGLFDCFVFYVPFWYIRVNFADTYHSDSWKHCKMWTRIMLCTGVFVLWLLPVKYSLFNGLFVAFGCCLILYLVAIEVNKKKFIVKENEAMSERINELLQKLTATATKDVYTMNEDELYEHCRSCGLDEEDCKIAYFLIIERLKGKELYNALPYSEATIKRKRLKIMSKIKKDVTTL